MKSEKIKSESSYNFKILTIGESGVGKTSIFRRYVDNKFYKDYLATVGTDFRVKTLNINDQEVKLKVWDTAGQERFSNITSQYYKGADGIVVVYDVTDFASFEKVKNWMGQIKENATNDLLCIILLGNKCDCHSEKRVVTAEMGEKLAEELKVKHFETSALENIGINDAFERLAKDIMKNKDRNYKSVGSISLNGGKAKDRGGGCCKK
jgi:small GTP-binding protein